MTDINRYPLESLFHRILSPIKVFLQQPTAGGIMLMIATVSALVLATGLGAETTRHFWEQQLMFSVENHFTLRLSWRDWINDGLMAVFFLFMGLEIKHEILMGELTSVKSAALPIVAAIGGMVVPAVIYTAFNLNTEAASGWGIPMATDIAFAVGVLTLLGQRIPKGLVTFLAALAIIDDLGAVLVIAIFYTSTLSIPALVAAGILFILLLLFNRGGIRHPLPYLLVGAALWYVVLISGIHATIAGILLAITIPSWAVHKPEYFRQQLVKFFAQAQKDSSFSVAVEATAIAAQSPLQRMERILNPWVTFVIVPIFALANAGIDLSHIIWIETLSEKVTLGVMLGLAVGKFMGISLFSWLAVYFRLGQLPTDVDWQYLLGAAWLGGIGFTMSIFINQLAFSDPLYIEQAKIGILLASGISAAIGLVWLYRAAART